MVREGGREGEIIVYFGEEKKKTENRKKLFQIIIFGLRGEGEQNNHWEMVFVAVLQRDGATSVRLIYHQVAIDHLYLHLNSCEERSRNEGEATVYELVSPSGCRTAYNYWSRRPRKIKATLGTWKRRKWDEEHDSVGGNT